MRNIAAASPANSGCERNSFNAPSGFAFFTLNTEMHERYLFPFVAFGLPLLFTNARTRTAYLIVSVLFFFNLLGVLPLGAIDRALYDEFPLLDGFIASGPVCCLIVLLTAAWNFGREGHRQPRGNWRQWLRRMKQRFMVRRAS